LRSATATPARATAKWTSPRYDLNACATLAVREMIDFLTTEKHLSRDDAYMLSSVAADLHITELVDGNKGVHMMLPKFIFISAPSTADKTHP